MPHTTTSRMLKAVTVLGFVYGLGGTGAKLQVGSADDRQVELSLESTLEDAHPQTNGCHTSPTCLFRLWTEAGTAVLLLAVQHAASTGVNGSVLCEKCDVMWCDVM